MARTRYKLTAQEVKRGKFKNGSRVSDGNNLYLSISNTGTRSWIVRITVNGVVRDMGLGSTDDVSLEQARKRTEEVRLLVKSGIDPLEPIEAPTPQMTLGEALNAYADDNATAWSTGDGLKRWNTVVGKHLKPIADRPVADVNVEDVLRVVRPLWKPKPRVAKYILSMLRRTLAYAAAIGKRDPNIANPADWNSNLKYVLPELPKHQHHTAMSYNDVPAFIAELRAKQTTVAQALEFIILTGARKTEVLGATWDEIDFTACTWTIPAHRMKARIEHVVPLTRPALALLRVRYEATKGQGYVFNGRNGPDSLIGVTSLAPYCPNVTIHGFRATLTQWLADKTDTSFETCEEILAHNIGNSVTRAYRRSKSLEKMGAALKRWSEYLNG